MGLKDDLIRQLQEKREKESEQRAEQYKRERQIAAMEQEEKERAKQSIESQFDQLRKNVEGGRVPQDWKDWYDKFIEKIKADVLGGKENFRVAEDVSEEYFYEKKNLCKGKLSETDLMNKYLTQRLVKDGFKRATFRLVDEIEYYATQEDYDRLDRDQKYNEAEAESRYQNALAEWDRNLNNDLYTRLPDRSSYRVKQAQLKCTGEIHHYRVVAEGGLYRQNDVTDKERGKSTPFFILKMVSVWLGAIVGLVLSIIYLTKIDEFFVRLGVKISPILFFIAGGVLGALLLFLIALLLTWIAVRFLALFNDRFSARRRISSAIGLLCVLGILTGAVIGGSYAIQTYFPFENVTQGGVVYKKGSDYYGIVGIEEGVTEITIPAEMRFNKVRLDELRYHLAENETVKTVTLTGNFTEIPPYSFRVCPYVEKIILPDSVTTIHEEAFCGCAKLAEIVLPDAVTEIETGAFRFCSSLKTIHWPKDLQIVRDNAFYGCSSLTQLDFSDSLQEVGENAFQDCSSVQSLKIGTQFAAYKETSFQGLTSLRDIYWNNETLQLRDPLIPHEKGYDMQYHLEIGKDVENFLEGLSGDSYGIFDTVSRENLKTLTFEEGGKLKLIGNGAFRYTGLQELVLPDGVEKIGSTAFGASSLQRVVLPDSVLEIGNRAFVNCENLQEVHLSQSLQKIGAEAFKSSGMTKVVIPDSVTSIGERAFAYCDLEEVTIGKSVVEIGRRAFYASDTIFTIYYNATSCPDFAEDLQIFNPSWSYGRQQIYVEVGANVVHLPAYLLAGNDNVWSVTFAPESCCESIGAYAFSEVKQPQLPASVVTIGEGAFAA